MPGAMLVPSDPSLFQCTPMHWHRRKSHDSSKYLLQEPCHTHGRRMPNDILWHPGWPDGLPQHEGTALPTLDEGGPSRPHLQQHENPLTSLQERRQVSAVSTKQRGEQHANKIKVLEATRRRQASAVKKQHPPTPHMWPFQPSPDDQGGGRFTLRTTRPQK